MARVLLSFGDPSVCETLRTTLEGAGHAVVARATGPDALTAAREEGFDVVLTEIELPGLPPFELVRAVGPLPTTRLVVVSERAAEVDRVVAFELGADDFVPRPFSPREVALRVAAVLRGGSADAPVQRIADLVIDRAAARVTKGGRALPLTRAELAILLDLVDARGAVRTRAQLLVDAVGAQASERAIDSHVKRLRQKLGSSAGLVETVTGVGYRLAVPGEDHAR